MRAAAIDIGTNSVLLVIAENTERGPRALLEKATITRLGAGVDRTATLAPEAIERTLACLSEYSEHIRAAGVQALDVVGTSAMRDAGRSDEFMARAEQLLGVAPRVISGNEEAELTFLGALSGLPVSGAVTVFDVGGGSTEIISGATGSAQALQAISLDIGSVRLFERHLASDPPTPAQLAAVLADVRTALEQVPAPAGDAPLVGVAGTVTTLAAIDQQLSAYDSDLVHGSRLSRNSIETLVRTLAATNLEDRKRITGLEPGRADVIVAGAAIVASVIGWSGRDELIVSDRGVRWGLIQRLMNS